MRQIRFRGKRIDNGEWVYGSLVIDNHPDINKSFIHHNDEKELFKRYSVEVDPSTVGQFTGLTDKNRVEIYEGDVYKYDNPNFGYGDTNQPEKLFETIKSIEELYDDDYLKLKLKYSEVTSTIHDQQEEQP